MGEKMETLTDFILLGSKITADVDCNHEIKRCLLLGRKTVTNPDSILKSRNITLTTKLHLVKAIFFSLVMYRCESWTIKKAERQRINAFELWCWKRLLRAPWTVRRLNCVNPKGNQSWIFIGKTEAEAPILWPPDAKNWFTGKDPDAGKDWRQEEKETTEDEMVGWHHRLDGHEFEQALGESEGWWSLVCCSLWGHSQTRLSHRTTIIKQFFFLPGYHPGNLNLPQMQRSVWAVRCWRCVPWVDQETGVGSLQAVGPGPPATATALESSTLSLLLPVVS